MSNLDRDSAKRILSLSHSEQADFMVALEKPAKPTEALKELMSMDDLVCQKCHMREKDATEFNLSGNGRAIAERNSAISKDSAKRAKIIFT